MVECIAVIIYEGGERFSHVHLLFGNLLILRFFLRLARLESRVSFCCFIGVSAADVLHWGRRSTNLCIAIFMTHARLPI